MAVWGLVSLPLCVLYSVRMGLGVGGPDAWFRLRLRFGVPQCSGLVGCGPLFWALGLVGALGAGNVVPLWVWLSLICSCSIAPRVCVACRSVPVYHMCVLPGTVYALGCVHVLRLVVPGCACCACMGAISVCFVVLRLCSVPLSPGFGPGLGSPSVPLFWSPASGAAPCAMRKSCDIYDVLVFFHLVVGCGSCGTLCLLFARTLWFLPPALVSVPW